jgi:hypothetical protein
MHLRQQTKSLPTLSFSATFREQIERAFLLGCTRKYVSWLNGQISGPIASLGYFRSIVDEVAQMETSPDYWRYIGESLDKYERAWLSQSTDGGKSVP